MTGPNLGLALSVGTLLVTALFGLRWRSRQGRVRPRTAGPTVAAALPEPVLARLDEAAAVTLLQLSTPVCARCPQTRALLSEVASVTPGVRHTELDLAEHPELAGALGVRSTPTTLVVSRAGQEMFRVVGVPRRTELLGALRPHL